MVFDLTFVGDFTFTAIDEESGVFEITISEDVPDEEHVQESTEDELEEKREL